MSEDLTDLPPLPAPRPLDRIPRKRDSFWPVVVVLFLVAGVVAGTIITFSVWKSSEPWRIQYPGVEWIRGEDANTREGKRYLQAQVRFDQDVLSASDFKLFLGELVTKTKGTYEYYHIQALNRRNMHVLDGVADQTGRHSITPTAQYLEQ